MQFNQLFSGYVKDADMACFMICLLLYIMVKVSLSFFNERNFNLFKESIVLVAVAALLRMGFYTVGSMDGPVLLTYLLCHAYNIVLIIVLNIYTAYVKTLITPDEDFGRFITVSSTVIFCIFLVFELGAQFTHYGFYYMGDGNWHFLSRQQPYAICYAYYLCIMGIMLVAYRDRIIVKLRATLIITQVMCLAWVFLDMLVGTEINYMTITYVLPILVILTMMHSRPFDMTTGAMNVGAFEVFYRTNKSRYKDMCFWVLQLNFETGEGMPVELGKELYNIYTDEFKDAMLFQVSNSRMVLCVTEDEKSPNELAAKYEEIYEKRGNLLYQKYKINYKSLVIAEISEEVDEKNVNDLFTYLFDGMELNEMKNVKESDVGDFLEYIKIRDALTEIHVNGDLDNETVKVFFQPAKNIKTGKYTTAEALARIENQELGTVSPDKFIPMAEKEGYIHILSLIMLNKTCKVIHELIEEGYEVDRIAVNFSLLDFIRDGMVESIIRIIASNDVPYEKIAIEITESQRVADISIVKEKIAVLKALGISFYLDDFGTGFSNFERILEMPFDVIKFDASLLYETEENRILVEHFARAFKDMGYMLQYEGVETKKQEMTCVNNNADYLQGYRFSKPLDTDEYKEFLRA